MEFLPKKLAREWSWRIDTGMPDYRNPLHLIELKRLLIERKFPYQFVDGLLGNLRGDIITEAATSETEEVHETFTSLAYAFVQGWCMNPKGIKTLNDYEVLVSGCKNLRDVESHLEVGRKWFKNGKMSSRQKKMMSDGISLARSIDSYLKKHASYSGWTYAPKYVTRAFPSTSPKPVGDMAIGLSSGYIDVSLKYGAGQFNSLSISDLLMKLYGISIGKTRLLNHMYSNGHANEIDSACNMYINYVLGQYDAVSLGGKYTQELKDLIDNSGLTTSSGWKDYKGVGTKVHKAFSRVYNHPESDKSAKKLYIDTKRRIINNAIDGFLKVGKNGLPKLQKNLASAIAFIIRAEPNKSYLYASKGGKKMTLLPSKKQIEQVAKTFTLKVRANTDDDGIIKSANYVQDVVVYSGNKELFTFDINWRFAGSGGQWSGDVDQKGAKFTFTDNFAKVFGLDKNPPVSD